MTLVYVNRRLQRASKFIGQEAGTNNWRASSVIWIIKMKYPKPLIGVLFFVHLNRSSRILMVTLRSAAPR